MPSPTPITHTHTHIQTKHTDVWSYNLILWFPDSLFLITVFIKTDNVCLSFWSCLLCFPSLYIWIFVHGATVFQDLRRGSLWQAQSQRHLLHLHCHTVALPWSLVGAPASGPTSLGEPDRGRGDAPSPALHSAGPVRQNKPEPTAGPVSLGWRVTAVSLNFSIHCWHAQVKHLKTKKKF